MARIIVTSDREAGCVAEIFIDDDAESSTYALTACGQRITDRGHFEDTVQQAERHVDNPDHHLDS